MDVLNSHNENICGMFCDDVIVNMCDRANEDLENK